MHSITKKIMIILLIQVWLLEKWINSACFAVPWNLKMKSQECAKRVKKWNCRNYIQHPNQYQIWNQVSEANRNVSWKFNYMPTFKVQGQIYHRAGSILPDADHEFLQIYFMGNIDEQIDSIPALNDKLSLDYKLYSINTTNELKRIQFPLLLAFAMTINKAQGQ